MKRRRPGIALSSDQRRIVRHVRTFGPLPRSRIAAELGMHNAAVTRLTRELITLGCLDEADNQTAGRGRPVVPLTLSGRIGYGAGAMAHPGWLELVLVDFAGAVKTRHAEPFDSPDPRAFAEVVGARLRDMALATDLMQSRFLGLGIAIPGYVADRSSSRRWTVKWLEGWRDIVYPDFFEEVLGFPVWVENESTLAGLADFYDHGLQQQVSSAITLFVGHGVGGSIIFQRDIVSGEYGNTGDLGRLFPDLAAPRPSGIDLLRDINAAGGGLRSLLDVERCMERHADVIASWTARASDQLLFLARSGAAWIDPGAVIVTGSVPVPVLDGIGARLRAATGMFGPAPMPQPSLHVSRLGSWAIPTGAALLPVQDMVAALR